MTSDRADPKRVGTKEDLARELTLLRSLSGLTVRELAKRIDSPAATLGDYFAGRHLPSGRQLGLYISLLAACGVTDSVDVDLWVAALARARTVSDGRVTGLLKARPPYRGLDPYEESETDLFFGRQAAVEELLEHLRARRDQPESGGLLVLVGASGSGKSSLLRAGLGAAVEAGALDGPGEHWRPTTVTPAQWVRDKRSVDRPTGDGPVLLIVDQLEEAFMLATEERQKLFSLLSGADRIGALAVASLRADFYQVAVAEPVLLPALRHAQILLAPMTEDDIREAILGPARQVGAVVEDSLVDVLISDLAQGGSRDFSFDPGSLPLLSYSLLMTWRNAANDRLTLADYREIGGLRGAVSQAAEEMYLRLDQSEQDTARRLFARLVHIDREGPPTRRRVDRRELFEMEAEEGGSKPVETIIERFVAARLLTTDARTVHVSHEAVLSAWPRLCEWIDSNRAWIRVNRQLSDAAEQWAESDRDESLLLRGTHLETTVHQVAVTGRALDINRTERDFLDASLVLRDAETRALRRRHQQTRRILALVAALGSAAFVMAGFAFSSQRNASKARDQALSRQMAIEAQELQPSDPSLAAQVAVAAYQKAETLQARSALVDATAGEIPTRLLGPVGPDFVSVSGQLGLMAVARSATDSVELYRLSSKGATALARVSAGLPSAQDFAVAISPDGKLLAAGGTSSSVVLWDISNPADPVRLEDLGALTGTVYSLAFSSDGRRVAAGTAGGTVEQWALGQPEDPSTEPALRLRALQVPAQAAVKAIAYSPVGQTLAAVTADGSLIIWPSGTTEPIVATGRSDVAMETVVFNPAGNELATGDADGDSDVWQLTSAGKLVMVHGLTAVTSVVYAAAFSPDGATLALGMANGSIDLYDTSTWNPLASFNTPDHVTGLAFTADGHTLVSTDSGGTTRLWPLAGPGSYTEPGPVFNLDYAARGSALYAGTSGPDGGVSVWDTSDPLHPSREAEISMPAGFGPAAGAMAVDPAGNLLAVANAKAQIQLVDTSTVGRPQMIGTPLTGSKPLIEQLDFSPDGDLLAAGDDGGDVQLWDVRDPARPVALPRLTVSAGGEVLGVSFNPDGRLLATASTDGRVRIYDLAEPSHPELVASLGGFSSYAYTAAFTPDGSTLVAGSADGTIRLWDVSDPDHPRLLGRPLTVPAGYVFSVAISADGRTLAAATTEHSVVLWNIANPSHPRLEDTLGAAQDEVFVVAFSPNSTVLVASGSDETLHFWRYQPSAASALVCAVAGDRITAAEWSLYAQGAPYHPPCNRK